MTNEIELTPAVVGELGWNFRTFVHVGLIPLYLGQRSPEQYVKHNGMFHAGMIPGKDGPPHGGHRVLPLAIAQKAREQGRTVRFESWAEILRMFDMPLKSENVAMLSEGIERLGDAHFWFAHMEKVEGGWADVREWFHFFNRAVRFRGDGDGWLVQAPKRRRFEITLSEEFWTSLQEEPVRLNMSILRRLTRSWGAFDLAQWLMVRAAIVERERLDGVRLGLKGDTGLMNQLAVPDGTPVKKFRQNLGRWMDTAAPAWQAEARRPFPLVWGKDKKTIIVKPENVIPVESF